MFTLARVSGQVWSEHHKENIFLYLGPRYLHVSHSCPFWKLQLLFRNLKRFAIISKVLHSPFLTRLPQSGHAFTKTKKKRHIFKNSLQNSSLEKKKVLQNLPCSMTLRMALSSFHLIFAIPKHAQESFCFSLKHNEKEVCW